MMELKWFGHASFRLTSGGSKPINLYFDPYFGDYQAEPKADVIFISHSHFDHSDQTKISQLKTEQTTILTSKENANNVQGIGLVAGQTHQTSQLTVTVVEAYNLNKFRSPGQPFHPKGFGLGFVVQVNSLAIYHAGDTDAIPEMAGLKNQSIDLALLPIGGTYTMTVDEALQAVKMIEPKVAIPMHFNTPTIGLPANPNEFKDKVESQTRTKVFILQPGEGQEL